MATAQTNLSGSEVGNGTFYLMNVGTGLYLKFGGTGNAKAAEGHAGTAITLAQSGNGYTIKTNVGYLDGNLKMTGTATEWTFEEVDAANNYYQIKNNDNLKYLASNSDAYGLLGLEAGNTANNKEKWMLVEKADLFSLFDMTPLIQAASFDTNDNVTDAWNISSDDISIAYEGTDAEEHYLEVTEATTITQNLGKAQVGNYVLSFEAHYTGEGDAPKVRLQLGNKNKDHAEITISKNDNWESYTGSIGVNGNVKGDIVITITTNTNTTLYLDNFELVYKEGKKQQIGDAEEEAQHKYDERALEEISLIRAYIEEYYPNGLTFFNDKISTMEENLKGEEVTISTESEYKNYLAQINQIKEDAKQEHRELSKENNDNNNIFNPGFEIGNLNAWITNGDIIKREEFTAGTAPGTGSYIFLGSISAKRFITYPLENIHLPPRLPLPMELT
ncbi:MAG: hypothetical protein J6S11_02250 [Bacteroidaceae bacterium]|nr:hypothetical protein [Bacteroidaceae bacterium]